MCPAATSPLGIDADAGSLLLQYVQHLVVSEIVKILVE
jgi:hypothetical protein